MAQPVLSDPKITWLYRIRFGWTGIALKRVLSGSGSGMGQKIIVRT